MGDRRQYDQKYNSSEKGIANKEKWHKWERIKNYYYPDHCQYCGRYRLIIARGLCDTCRKKK